MHTVFCLMARHNAQVVIPVKAVVADYFPHLSIEKFVRKVSVGDINIPLIRIEPKSQKSAKGVHILDMAHYIDARREAAFKEVRQLTGRD